MKSRIVPLFIALFTVFLEAGEHLSRQGGTFHLKNVSVTAKSREYKEAATQFASLASRVLKTEVPLSDNGSIVFEKASFADSQMYEIITSEKGILIKAASPMAANFAGADLLREMGYRRFAPHPAWECLPDTPPETISVNKREAPDYLARSIWPGWGLWPEYRKLPDHKTWRYANRLGGIDVRSGHVYGAFVAKNKKTLDAHPEYYALVKGNRTGDKLCISNPELRKLFAQYAVDTLKKTNADSVSVEPSDGGGWCECPECAKLGTPTDRAIILANEAADAVSQAFPGKYVALYAYNQHSPAPSKGIAVRPNVIINIATMFIRGGNSVEQQIDAWSPRAAIGIREYYYAGTAPGDGRACDLGYLKKTLPDFHGKGARYISAEAGECWGAGLLGWNLAAHLMWNVNADTGAFLEDFFARAFPRSGKPMRQFFALVNAVPPKALSEDLLHRMYETLSEARQLADGQERERITQLLGYTWFCEKLFRHENGARNEATYRDLLEVAATIKPTYMVHTYAIFRDERKLGLPKKKIAATYDWKTPRHPDWDTILTEGLKNNRKLDFDVINFGHDLVPVTFPGPNASATPAGLRSKQKYYLWLDSKPLALKITGGLIKHYRNRGNVKIKLIQIGGTSDTGQLETQVAFDDSVPPDGEQHTVTLAPKNPGLHRLEMDDGADMTRTEFPSGLPVAYPVEREKMGNFSSVSYWFYVPKGTKVLGYFAATSRGVIAAPNGRDFDRLDKKKGYYSKPIPEEFTGKVWRIRGMNGVLRLLTVPDSLNLNSSILLIPRSVAEKDALSH